MAELMILKMMLKMSTLKYPYIFSSIEAYFLRTCISYHCDFLWNYTRLLYKNFINLVIRRKIYSLCHTKYKRSILKEYIYIEMKQHNVNRYFHKTSNDNYIY
jgi:hypothetical protein